MCSFVTFVVYFKEDGGWRSEIGGLITYTALDQPAPHCGLQACFGHNMLRKNLINIFPMGNYYKSYGGSID